MAVSELTVSEHFLIWRRRSGLTQTQAGKMIGMTRHQYCEFEMSNTDVRPSSFFPSLSEIYSYEKCFLFRRRSGWTIPMCADQAGVSRYWYNMMELGKVPPERLIKYWIENEG